MFSELVKTLSTRAPRAQPARDPPDVQDVLTQQTEVLAGMLAELRARQGPVPVANAAEPPEDPDFDWSRLVMPPETSFQVPGNGTGPTDGFLPDGTHSNLGRKGPIRG